VVTREKGSRCVCIAPHAPVLARAHPHCRDDHRVHRLVAPTTRLRDHAAGERGARANATAANRPAPVARRAGSAAAARADDAGTGARVQLPHAGARDAHAGVARPRLRPAPTCGWRRAARSDRRVTHPAPPCSSTGGHRASPPLRRARPPYRSGRGRAERAAVDQHRRRAGPVLRRRAQQRDLHQLRRRFHRQAGDAAPLHAAVSGHRLQPAALGAAL